MSYLLVIIAGVLIGFFWALAEQLAALSVEFSVLFVVVAAATTRSFDGCVRQ